MTASFENILRDMSNPGDRMDFIDHTLRPPEPQLLDTCILQNLDWVDRRIEQKERWDDAAVAALTATYGEDMANDLLDLGVMYKHFEDLGGYPWLVCDVNASEASLLGGDRGIRLNDIIRFFNGHQDDLCNDAFPAVALGLLGEARAARVSPLILRRSSKFSCMTDLCLFYLIAAIARSRDMRYWQIFQSFSPRTARRSGNIAQP
jgi:hypothetical protein